METLDCSIRQLSRAIEGMWAGIWKMMESYMGPEVLGEVRETIANMVQSERELEALRGTRAAQQVQQIQDLCEAAGFYANDPVERVFNALIRQGASKTAAAVRAKATELALPFVRKSSE